MAAAIIMTAEQADHVRGRSLQPIERQNGVFILNTLVLDDPEHAEFHDYLAALPTMDIEHPAFPPAMAIED